MTCSIKRRRKQVEDPLKQEVQYHPWLVMISGMTAGAALVGATAAFIEIFGG